MAALVLAHGAGAGMRHRHMQALADAFGRAGLATLRFDFPFIEAGKKHVDSQAVATASIAAAFASTVARTTLPVWLGGHSFGGRMASHAVVDRQLTPRGLIFCSFPLHAPGKQGIERARHLAQIRVPMLFLSGTRDTFAARELLEPLVAGLAAGGSVVAGGSDFSRDCRVHFLDTADHGFRTLKRERASTEDVYDEAARAARAFIGRHSRDALTIARARPRGRRGRRGSTWG
ncbi:MAG TPA: alpha/beta family hydrolase [Gammaproteobacteria bacterium]